MPDGQELTSGNIGDVGKYEVDFVDGKLVAKANASSNGIDAKMEISISGKAVLDGIAAKIGGAIPAEIAAFLESALGLK